MKRNPSAMARRVEDELVILDVESGRFFGLNDVGAAIWDRLGEDCSQDELVDAVAGAFDVERDSASVDVAELVDQLVGAGLVVR